MLVGVELVIMLHHIITWCSLHMLLVALIRLHVAIFSLKSQVAREKISRSACISTWKGSTTIIPLDMTACSASRHNCTRRVR
jgi:hypothetical protein